MKLYSKYTLSAALLALASAAVLAQAPAPPAGGTAPERAAPPSPAAPLTPEEEKARFAERKRRGSPDSFRPRARHLIYVTEPGSLEQPAWLNGTGIIVLDASDNYRFVKRIPVWEYAASMSPEQVSGVAASPVTNMIYVAARGRIAAIDMGTDRMVWTTELDGKCCERPQVTPDGKTIVVGADLQDYWYELDAATGKLIGRLEAPESLGSHNLNLSADGKTAFMSPNGKVMTISDVKTRKVIRTVRFPENVRVFVVNKDSSKIFSNQGQSLGFVIVDVASGKITKTVDVTSVNWRPKWNAVPRPKIPHACPSHGIALVNDETEIWLADGIFNKIHVFSNTDDPKEIDTIDTTGGPFWLTVGLDGKLVYSSSGDVIDAKTHKILTQLKDEYGNRMYSEKLLDMTFDNGHAQRVSNQFGNGYGDYVTAEQLGVGPHVTPLPGTAPITITTMKAGK
jgi:DNA-binding beta-propeller fold protein YncE